MARFVCAVVLLVGATAAHPQDMPLHEILKPGETWQPQAGPMPAQTDGARQHDLKGRPLRVLATNPDGTTAGVRHEFKEPIVGISTRDGQTFLIADAGDRYIWAVRWDKDRSLETGDRYMRLRVKGDDRRKKINPPEAYRADPSALAVDSANRTYVATNLGIQVFDPTGRLCGVFTAPAGRVTDLAFAGDRLYARVGAKVFARRMLAEGNRSD